jgi:mercuric reductase
MSANPTKNYDLAIIGSGSAAFSAAIHANGLGAQVVLIEQGTIGGTCVNVGCVPSKALLAAAEARHGALTQPFPGISTQARPVDMGALIGGKRDLVEGLRHDKYEDLAEAYGFPVVHGVATFTADGALHVHQQADVDGGEEIRADHYVIATGAVPSIPSIPGLESVKYLTSTTTMELKELPGSLLVIGANAIGLELAQLFSHLGAKVTVFEVRDRIAPFEEPEISAMLERVLVEEGVEVLTGSSIGGISQVGDQIHVELTRLGQARSLEGDALLVATGRMPNTASLGLEYVGVELGPRGEVVVDDQLRTTSSKIFAAGDVTGAPQFVYVAGQHGTIVADNALRGAGRRVDYRTLPRVTFTSPQVASVGLTDEGAVAAGYRCDCRVLELSSVPRALVNRDTRGLVKIVADGDTGVVLGIHLLANGAADAILAGVYALEANFTVDQLASIWAPYLTMSEAIRLGAQSFTRDVGMLSCCAS